MKSHELKKRIMLGEKFSQNFILEQFELFRSKEPTVYNIETTNACNMKCKMCPRTTKMDRPIVTIEKETFESVLKQLKPWSGKEWDTWVEFVKNSYKIYEDDQSENHFFLYIIPKVIQLHGYGDPLLDKNMPDYIKLMNEQGFYSYFSCNPANIDIQSTIKMFENGLSYIKYSIESVDDEKHREIRGDASNFSESYSKICELLDLKKKHNYQTTIIITMLDLNHSWQQEEFIKLRDLFKNMDVYIYLKSEDQQWYRKEYHGTNSVHWSEICRHPWMSMTVKSNSDIAMCMEDYNNEIVLGNARKNSLVDIWNGKKYNQFRIDHLELTRGIKCTEECDMKLVGEYQ
jgi:MoaA/NifB/PqqE/SkfB family radical SAM enzyme